MSAFIQTREAVEPPPLFQVQSREVHEPNSKLICKKIRAVWHPKAKGNIERIAKGGLHQKLCKKEKDISYTENSETIMSNYRGIKKRWFKTCQSLHENANYLENSVHSPLHQFFEDKVNERDEIDMKEIMRNMPKKVFLEKKYNSQVMIKYSTINQALEIDENKKDYRLWHDKNNNNSLKSPIFLQIARAIKFLPKQPQRIDRISRTSCTVRTSKTAYRARKKNEEFCSISKQNYCKPIFTNQRLIAQI